MACEYFSGDSLTRCGAVEGQLIPSLYERERYCQTAAYRSCPTYRLYQVRRQARQGPLPQAAYYALWLAPPVQFDELDRDAAEPEGARVDSPV